MNPELFLNSGNVAPARPWFPAAGCCESDHLRQVTHRLVSFVIEHRPKGTMLVIEIAGPPQYIGKGSFVSSESAPAQGRLETSPLSLVHGLIGRLETALGHPFGAGTQALDSARGGLGNEADAVRSSLPRQCAAASVASLAACGIA